MTGCRLRPLPASLSSPPPSSSCVRSGRRCCPRRSPTSTPSFGRSWPKRPRGWASLRSPDRCPAFARLSDLLALIDLLEVDPWSGKPYMQFHPKPDACPPLQPAGRGLGDLPHRRPRPPRHHRPRALGRLRIRRAPQRPDRRNSAGSCAEPNCAGSAESARISSCWNFPYEVTVAPLRSAPARSRPNMTTPRGSRLLGRQSFRRDPAAPLSTDRDTGATSCGMSGRRLDRPGPCRRR